MSSSSKYFILVILVSSIKSFINLAYLRADDPDSKVFPSLFSVFCNSNSVVSKITTATDGTMTYVDDAGNGCNWV